MWDDESISSALTSLTAILGKHPSSIQIRESQFSGLDNAISKHPLKHNGWRKKLGAHVRKSWDDGEIERDLKVEAKKYGRMPTANELSSAGKGDLANAIRRSELLFRGWAKKIGVPLKHCETHRSFKMEQWVKAELEERGHGVELTTAKCSYDLLVDSSLKVEVKMAKRTIVTQRSIDAFVFSFGAKPESRDIDFAVLVCVDKDDNPLKVYVLSCEFCQQQTISITGSHRWKPFLNAWNRFC